MADVRLYTARAEESEDADAILDAKIRESSQKLELAKLVLFKDNKTEVAR